MRLFLIWVSPAILPRCTCFDGHIWTTPDGFLRNNQSSVWFVEKRNRRVAGYSSSAIIHGVKRVCVVVQSGLLIVYRNTSAIPDCFLDCSVWALSFATCLFLVRFLLTPAEQTTERPNSPYPALLNVIQLLQLYCRPVKTFDVRVDPAVNPLIVSPAPSYADTINSSQIGLSIRRYLVSHPN